MSTVGISQMTNTKESPGITAVSLGRKYLMALTGVILILFIIVHLIGNLQVFIGQDQFNTYAHTLQSMTVLKWIFRAGLALFFIVHIWEGLVLWWKNHRARPVKYNYEKTIQASIASRTMIYTGGLIFFFVLYHLLHFTAYVTNPDYANLQVTDGHDAFGMVVTGFSNPIIAIVYIIAMGCLALHLSHSASSWFQTFGLNNEIWRYRLEKLGNLFAIAIFVLYSIIPLAVLVKIVTLPGGGH